MQPADTNNIIKPTANMPDPTPEAVLLTALLMALHKRDKAKKRKPGRPPILDALDVQLSFLEELPIRLSRESAPFSRALAGARAVLTRTMAAAS